MRRCEDEFNVGMVEVQISALDGGIDLDELVERLVAGILRFKLEALLSDVVVCHGLPL